MSYIKENIDSINTGIAEAAKNCGRKAEDVKLIAVTKTYGVDVINEAIDCGVTDIGENRVQEIMEKYEHVKPVRWHLIGHLQKNKVKYIIDKVSLIHSVDSLGLAEEINKQAAKIEKVQDILIQVNVSGEESKFGVEPDECMELCEKISALPNVRICGLMTVAPFVEDEKLLAKVFDGLRQISLDISAKLTDTVYMDELSMGMTNDYPIAVANGATMVRVGTAIFGQRNYNV